MDAQHHPAQRRKRNAVLTPRGRSGTGCAGTGMNRSAVVTPLSGVRHWARTQRGRIAIVEGGRRVTYAELSARIDAAATYFAQRGAGTGSVIGVSLRNGIDAMVIPLAAAALGAQISPVNFRLRARELRAIAG